MLWRLLRRNDLGKYGEEGCWAIVEFDTANEAVSQSIASELLQKEFNVLLVGKNLEHVQKPLAAAHAHKRIAVLSNGHLESDERSAIFTKSLGSMAAKATIVIIPAADPACTSRKLNAENTIEPNSTLLLLRTILPSLRKDRPIAIAIVGGPLSFYSDEHVLRNDYYEAFTNTLLQEMRDLKLENVEFLYSDCHSSSSADEGQARSGTWMNPSPESYAKSVLQSVGCGHAQVVAYWPHEFLAWVLWILLLVLPRGTLQSLGRRIGL
ncbi:hypothetical protein SCHPADRAFT_116043 [Schizopora paradoxa]|uniref:Uncharacterized protein n=1 Tax=Schizopora paradoxa TaxID=27342 RepID=A0A0H2S2Q9_9AGAM|nr:hypothetical protein SCHPADRAFT_116043 [Schizopora paradoxa]